MLGAPRSIEEEEEEEKEAAAIVTMGVGGPRRALYIANPRNWHRKKPAKRAGRRSGGGRTPQRGSRIPQICPFYTNHMNFVDREAAAQVTIEKTILGK